MVPVPVPPSRHLHQQLHGEAGDRGSALRGEFPQFLYVFLIGFFTFVSYKKYVAPSLRSVVTGHSLFLSTYRRVRLRCALKRSSSSF